MPALIDKGTLYDLAKIIASNNRTTVIPGNTWGAEPRANILYYPERDLMYTEHKKGSAPPNIIPSTQNVPSLLDMEYAKDSARTHGSLVRGLLWRAAGTLRYGDSNVEPYETYVDTILDLEDELKMDLRVIHPLDLVQVYAKAELGRVEHELRSEYENLADTHLPPVGSAHRPSVDDLLKQIGDLHKNSNPDEEFAFNMDLFFEEAGRCAFILGGAPELLSEVAAASGINYNVLQSFADIGKNVTSSEELVKHLGDMAEPLISAAINYARKKPPEEPPTSGGDSDQQSDQQQNSQQNDKDGSSGSGGSSGAGDSDSSGGASGDQNQQQQSGSGNSNGGGIPQLTDEEKQQIADRNARNDDLTKNGVQINAITGSVEPGEEQQPAQEMSGGRSAGQTSPYEKANDLPFDMFMDAIKPIRDTVDDAFRRLRGMDGSYQLVRHQRSGKFNPHVLGQVSSTYIEDPFMKLREEYPRHLHIGVIIDDSGSMCCPASDESPLDRYLSYTRNMDLAIAFLIGISEGAVLANGSVVVNSMNRPTEFHQYSRQTREQIFHTYDGIGGTDLARPMDVMREYMRKYEGIKIIVALSDGDLPSNSLTSYHEDCKREGISARLLVIGDKHGLAQGQAMLGPENAKELSFKTVRSVLDEWCTELARLSVR